MAFTKYQNTNNASSLLIADISASATTMLITDGDQNLFPSSFPFLLTLEHLDSEGNVILREIVKATASNQNSYTVVRGAGTCVQDDTASNRSQDNTAHAFYSGDRVSLYRTSEQVKDIQDRLETSANDTAIADEYNSSQTYVIGDIVMYKGDRYVCSTDVSTAEEFDSTKRTKVSVQYDLGEAQDNISNHETRIDSLETAIGTLGVVSKVDVLIIGGGGSSGRGGHQCSGCCCLYAGPGGGAGGVIELQGFPLTKKVNVVRVGSGGCARRGQASCMAYGVSQYPRQQGAFHGENGGNSEIEGTIAYGGGGACNNGGSGGGGLGRGYPGQGGDFNQAQCRIGGGGGPVAETLAKFPQSLGGGALCQYLLHNSCIAGTLQGYAYAGGIRPGSCARCGAGGYFVYLQTSGANCSYACKGFDGIVVIRYPADGSYGITNATGGTKTSYRGIDGRLYCVHTFTSDGKFSIDGTDDDRKLLRYVVVGGGGGGVYGGGGGGAVCHGYLTVNGSGSMDIVVGTGGKGCKSGQAGTSGTASSISGYGLLGPITANGGCVATTTTGGASGSGKAGGTNYGGGGGADSVGGNGGGSQCGGKSGLGVLGYGYGGGGGGQYYGGFSQQNSGIGGGACTGGYNGCNASCCGGGGGGTYNFSSYSAGNGGNGVVEICYPADSGIVATGGTKTLVGCYCMHRFTSNGTFTIQ